VTNAQPVKNAPPALRQAKLVLWGVLGQGVLPGTGGMKVLDDKMAPNDWKVHNALTGVTTT
jgi:hypothetical protein